MRLVVPAATRLKAQISANRSHVPLQRPGDGSDGAGDYRELLPDGRRAQDLGQVCKRANSQALILRKLNLSQMMERLDVDQEFRREQPHLQIGDDVGSSGDDHRVGAVVAQHADCLIERTRMEGAKRRKTHRDTPEVVGFGGFRSSLPAAKSETRSEEHTSELQSPVHLVCRLLLEKKKNTTFKKKGDSKIWCCRQSS